MRFDVWKPFFAERKLDSKPYQRILCGDSDAVG
jgi:hypothetical protein